jgi:hypothetical protein
MPRPRDAILEDPMSHTLTSPAPRRILALAALGAITLLTGCYVVPIQPQPSIYPPPQAVPVVPVAATDGARLYPLNDIAAQTGMLTATVTDHLNGRGTFAVNLGNEPMQGEASRVADNYPGYGRVHQQVFGQTPRPVTGFRKGIANAAGGRGAYVNCEYTLNAQSNGTGACIFSNGAKYQLHFGA